MLHFNAIGDSLAKKLMSWSNLLSYAAKKNVTRRSIIKKEGLQLPEKTSKTVDGRYEVEITTTEGNTANQDIQILHNRNYVHSVICPLLKKFSSKRCF